MEKIVTLILAILLCFSFEDTPQSKVILSNELTEKTENQYYKINEIKEKIQSKKQTYSRFLLKTPVLVPIFPLLTGLERDAIN